MTSLDEKIVEFLNVPLSALNNVDTETLTEMRNAVGEDDFFTLHHLGYKVKADRIWFVAPPGTGKIHEVISTVEEMEPCILFLDEIEKAVQEYNEKSQSKECPHGIKNDSFTSKECFRCEEIYCPNLPKI